MSYNQTARPGVRPRHMDPVFLTIKVIMLIFHPLHHDVSFYFINSLSPVITKKLLKAVSRLLYFLLIFYTACESLLCLCQNFNYAALTIIVVLAKYVSKSICPSELYLYIRYSSTITSHTRDVPRVISRMISRVKCKKLSWK